MTALLKRGDKLASLLRPEYQPDDEDYIKTLDYEELEKRFEIHKYYPKFIHNYDYSTPQIRQMLRDKPIYAKANEHLKNFKNPGSRKTFVTEIDVETGQIQVREKKTKEQEKREKREKKEAKKESRRDWRDSKKDARRELREVRKDDRKDRQLLRKEIIETKREDQRQQREKSKTGELIETEKSGEDKINGGVGGGEIVHTAGHGTEQNGDHKHSSTSSSENSQKSDVSRNGSRKLLREYKSQRKAEKTAQPYVAPAIKPPSYSKATRPDSILFTNPFDAKIPAILGSTGAHEGVRSRQNSVRTMESVNSETLKLSIGGKLRHIMRRNVNKSSELVRTSSYDQTQLMMTSTRGAKNKLLRLKDDSGRRMSHQVGTYTNTERKSERRKKWKSKRIENEVELIEFENKWN